MDDSQSFTPRPKMFRRRRKHEGETWLESLQFETEQLKKDRGLMCKECRKWIPWKDLTASYEMWGTMLVRMWVCVCDNVLTYDDMTATDKGVSDGQGPNQGEHAAGE